MNIGDRLKLKRTDLKLTQEKIADELHVSRQTISSWETGRSYPDIEKLIQLSNYFEISLDELLKEDVGMINDIKAKTELNENKKIYYASYAINLLLFILVTFNLFEVAGFKMPSIANLIIIAIIYINGVVVTKARQKYSKLIGKPVFTKYWQILIILVGIALILAIASFSSIPYLHQLKFKLLGASVGMLLATTTFSILMRSKKETKQKRGMD
ncbi:MAG: helix-turn-helix domain-containing protein [Streptococcaceae bacterium]|jgi:transcriptional regulator with XRE-family HTH domain|nr:helix-turn-helix domain-containing protein [Streptococcaceae bacterium]MCH4177843.1 helix-turn-helix domain-containing protein [Streptococcaceae bacterium]